MPFLDVQPKLSLVFLRHLHTITVSHIRQELWTTNDPNSYIRLNIRTAPLFPRKLLLNRKFLGHIIATKTGHGDFAAYHDRFNHLEAITQYHCRSCKTPTHSLLCRIVQRRGGRPKGPAHHLTLFPFGTVRGASTLIIWLDHVRYFEKNFSSV